MGRDTQQWAEQSVHTHAHREKADRQKQPENPTDREDVGTASVCGLGGVSFFYWKKPIKGKK